ncbi:hypothetical protein SDC9_75526 [bioreactor metagenome]|uniref:Uncharacterized protein n=1 Tax=bioreactor metagenome TaxID=1076179 RepID=A0A644YLW4_9ZZZZ
MAGARVDALAWWWAGWTAIPHLLHTTRLAMFPLVASSSPPASPRPSAARAGPHPAVLLDGSQSAVPAGRHPPGRTCSTGVTRRGPVRRTSAGERVGQRCTEPVRRPAPVEDRGARGEQPAVGQWPCVDGIEPDGVQQGTDPRRRFGAVRGDRQRPAPLLTARAGVGADLAGPDVVERADDEGAGQVLLDQFAGRAGIVVDLGDPPVDQGQVVHHVDDDASGQRLRRQRAVAPQRDGGDDDVAGVRLGARDRLDPGQERGDLLGRHPRRPPRREAYVVVGAEQAGGDRHPEVPGPEDPDGQVVR